VLRTVADPGSSVDVFAIAASERYDIPAGDLAEVSGSARRRHRTLFEVFEELQSQPGLLRLSAAGRTALARLTGDLRRYRELIRTYLARRGFEHATVNFAESEVTATSISIIVHIDEMPGDDDNH